MLPLHSIVWKFVSRTVNTTYARKGSRPKNSDSSLWLRSFEWWRNQCRTFTHSISRRFSNVSFCKMISKQSCSQCDHFAFRLFRQSRYSALCESSLKVKTGQPEVLLLNRFSCHDWKLQLTRIKREGKWFRFMVDWSCINWSLG